MILIDEPTNRHLCPVTLFLSMAIADGVVDGITCDSDIAALSSHCQQSGWLPLPYKLGSLHLPVLRRTGNRSRVMSSCIMKPSALYIMMQEQFDRAGHEATFSTMLRDVRNANQRERRRKAATDHMNAETLLMGRGQGRCISTILAFEPTIPPEKKTFHTTASLQPPYPLPHMVDVQLRYDLTRSTIISYLFGSYAVYHTLPDILYAFAKAAESVAHEPFYVDAFPDASGSCPWCGAQLKR